MFPLAEMRFLYMKRRDVSGIGFHLVLVATTLAMTAVGIAAVPSAALAQTEQDEAQACVAAESVVTTAPDAVADEDAVQTDMPVDQQATVPAEVDASQEEQPAAAESGADAPDVEVPDGEPAVDDEQIPAEGDAEQVAEDVGDPAQAGAEGTDLPVETEVDKALANASAAAADQSKGKAAMTAQSTPAGKNNGGHPLPNGWTRSVANGTYIFETNGGDDKVLGVVSAVAGEAVKSLTYKGTGNQKWVVKEIYTGWYRIYLESSYSKASDKSYGVLCLGKAMDSNDVTVIWNHTSGDRSLWAFVTNGSWFNLVNRELNEAFLVLNKSGVGKDGGKMEFVDRDKSPSYARFYLLDPAPKVAAGNRINDGSYEVSPTTNTKLAAEVRRADKSNGANLWLWTGNGATHQRIYLESAGNGYYTAWVVGTSKVLAQASSSVMPGNNIVQRAYASGNALQLWAIHSYGDGTYSLVNKGTGLAMGAAGTKDGSNLAGTRNDGYKTTRFKLTRYALLTAGIVEIHPRTTSGVSLDVSHSASSGNAALLLWKSATQLNQRFELVSAGMDLWRIRTASSGGWITNTSSGIQQSGTGSTAKSDANTWQVCFKGGWYTLLNKATGKALDMRGGKTASGTSIISYTPNGADSQHFSFVASSLMTAGTYTLECGSGRCLDVQRSSLSAGGNIIVWDKASTLNQCFAVAKSGSDWTIMSMLSDLYLTAASGGSGANVTQQKRASSNRAQLWRFAIADGGRIALRNVANTAVSLNASGNGAKSGANVELATNAQNNGQSWKLSHVSNDTGINAKQRAVINACKSTKCPGAGFCALWVSNVFVNAGIGSYGGNACDMYRNYCKSSSTTALRPGMIVAVSTHGKSVAGGIYGHVGIYIGGGLMMDSIGYIRTIELSSWMSYYGDRVTVKWGWLGGRALA